MLSAVVVGEGWGKRVRDARHCADQPSMEAVRHGRAERQGEGAGAAASAADSAA
jgi:hypothetical protein